VAPRRLPVYETALARGQVPQPEALGRTRSLPLWQYILYNILGNPERLCSKYIEKIRSCQVCQPAGAEQFQAREQKSCASGLELDGRLTL
jgi:hypothetical protein